MCRDLTFFICHQAYAGSNKNQWRGEGTMLTGLILAGGPDPRLGGKSKALMPFGCGLYPLHALMTVELILSTV
jgi:hypothetical protein